MKKVVAKNNHDEVVTRGYLNDKLVEFKKELMAELNPRFDDLQKRFERFSDLIIEELKLNRQDRKLFALEHEGLHNNDLRQELAIDALEQRVEVLESAK